MMKNQDLYAVAVRKPDGEIEIDTEEYHGVLHGSKIKKIPFIRGVFNFLDSLILGMRTLTYSASFYEDEEAKETVTDKAMNKVFGDKAEKILMGITVAFSIVLAIGIFMILPYYLSSLFETYVRNTSLLALIEGVIRIAIFLVYVVAISLMQDIRRVYMYHGAEHKTIFCYEKDLPLTVENVRLQRRFHPRCGTSFMILMLIVGVFIGMLIPTGLPSIVRALIKIALLPLSVGIGYEAIKFCGRHDNRLTRIIAAPGTWLQHITTREPDDDMIECAITAFQAVIPENEQDDRW